MENQNAELILTPINETLLVEDDSKSCTHNFSDDEEDPELIECKKCHTFTNFSEGNCRKCKESFLTDNKTGYFLGDGFIEAETIDSEVEDLEIENDSGADEKELSDYETSDEEYETAENGFLLSEDEEWLPPKNKKLKSN